MPKNKRNKKSDNKQPSVLPGSGPVPEDDDTVSVITDHSESTNNASDGADDSLSDQMKYEGKIKEAMEYATVKSGATRTNALISLSTALQKRVMTSFLLDNYKTLEDLVEKSLKKGKVDEQVAAVRFVSTLIISLANCAEAEELFITFKPIIRVILLDPTASPVLRTECAHTFALTAFLACPEPHDNITDLHSIFSAALPKGNGELPSHSPEKHALHAAALQGFCLLLTRMPPFTTYTMAPKLLKEFLDVMQSNDLELRIMVGESVALIYECCRSHRDDFRWQKHNEAKLLEAINDLATDSHKYRAKKDRKQQRASFREISRSVRDGEMYEETITLGPAHHKQDLILGSWEMRWQYQALCHALGEGLNMHMIMNPMVRDLFDLGPPPLQLTANLSVHKNSIKRPSRESPATKARFLTRSKNRDKRAAAMAYED